MAAFKRFDNRLPQNLSAGRSYAEVLQNGFKASTSGPTKPPSSYRRWNPAHRSGIYCYRCGGRNHLASACREPIRCFRCGDIGHKRFNCSRFKTQAAPPPNLKSLSQAWCSMIYHDDSSLQDISASPSELNEDQFQFNLKYLKLRKILLLSGMMDITAALGLLDGLFNSNYITSVIAKKLAVEASTDEERDREQEFKDMQNITNNCALNDSVPLPVRKAELVFMDDVMLVDPEVAFCRQKAHPDSSSVRGPKVAETMADPSTELDKILVMDRAVINSDIYVELESSDSIPPGSPMLGKCFSLARSKVYKRTDLTLFNSFELLNFCLENDSYEDELNICNEGHHVDTSCSTSDPEYTVHPPARNADADGVFKTYSFCASTVLTNQSSFPEGLVIDATLKPVLSSGLVVDSMRCDTRDLATQSDFIHHVTESDGEAPFCTAEGPILRIVRSDECTFIAAHNNDDGPTIQAAGGVDLGSDMGEELIHSRDLLCEAEILLSPVTTDCYGDGQDVLDNGRPHSSPILGGADPCFASPSSGSRRGRKKKGFYDRNVVRRSARLCGTSDRALASGGGVPESGADSTSDSGSGMTSSLGSTFSPCALNNLSTSDMFSLARNSGFSFDDLQLDTDFIRARELERVNSLRS